MALLMVKEAPVLEVQSESRRGGQTHGAKRDWGFGRSVRLLMVRRDRDGGDAGAAGVAQGVAKSELKSRLAGRSECRRRPRCCKAGRTCAQVEATLTWSSWSELAT